MLSQTHKIKIQEYIHARCHNVVKSVSLVVA